MPQRPSGPIHQRTHPRDAFEQTHEERFADEVMPDIELDNLRNRGDWDDIIIVEPVPGMHLQAQARGASRAMGQPFQLMMERETLGSRRRCTIGTGMELDGIGADIARGLDLLRFGIDEQRYMNAGAPEFGDERRKRADLARDIEAALGGDLLGALEDETTGMRLRLERDR